MTNKKKDSLFSRIKGKFFNSDDEDDFEIIEDDFDGPNELEDYESRYHGDESDEGLEAIDDDLTEEERDAILRKELGDDYTPVFNEELLASAEEMQDEDRTDPGFVLEEEVQETEADKVEENLQFPEDPTEEVQFPETPAEEPMEEESEFADDADEDEVFEALEAEAPLALEEEIEEDDEEDDEPFEAQPMVLSEEDKEDIEDEMEDLDEVFPETPQEMPRPEPTREIDLNQMQAQADEYDYSDEDYDVEPGDFDEFQVPGKASGFKGKVTNLFSKVKGALPGGGGGGGRRPPGGGSFMPKKSGSFKLPESFDWDAIYNKIFAPESRPAIHRGFLALLFAVSTYGVGKMAALAIKGKDTGSTAVVSSSFPRDTYRARPEMNTVAQTDLFNAPGEIAKDPCKENPNTPGCKGVPIKKKDEKKVCVAAKKRSSLSISLVNTLVLQDTVKSIAAVQIRSSKDVLNLREGEKIEDMAQIGRIDRQKLIFKNLQTGTCEFIANEDKNLKKMSPLTILSPTKGKKLLEDKNKDGIKNTGHAYKIPSKVREQMLANISEVLTQARAIQINNPDGTLSFKLTEIVPNSIYSKLDIQNDDIIKTINGKPIKNINEVMTLFGNIRQIDHFELGILRNGAEVNKEYDFE